MARITYECACGTSIELENLVIGKKELNIVDQFSLAHRECANRTRDLPQSEPQSELRITDINITEPDGYYYPFAKGTFLSGYVQP